MKKMSMKKKLVAVISGVLGLMMVGVVAVNGIGAKASDYPVDSVQDIDGRGVYTMDGAKFRGYSWIAPVYGEENLFGKSEVEGGTLNF